MRHWCKRRFGEPLTATVAQRQGISDKFTSEEETTTVPEVNATKKPPTKKPPTKKPTKKVTGRR